MKVSLDIIRAMMGATFHESGPVALRRSVDSRDRDSCRHGQQAAPRSQVSYPFCAEDVAVVHFCKHGATWFRLHDGRVFDAGGRPSDSERFFTAFLTLQQRPRDVPAVRLSGREQEVLKWCANGKTRAEIGAITGLSVHTVQFHVRKILRKLDANNATLAVLKALHVGLIRF